MINFNVINEDLTEYFFVRNFFSLAIKQRQKTLKNIHLVQK